MERNWFLEINKYGWAGREVEGGGREVDLSFILMVIPVVLVSIFSILKDDICG